MDEHSFQNIGRILNSENAVEREAAALACYGSHYPPALELLNGNNELKNSIETGRLTWLTIAQKQ
jgi:hypothetical protein